jgi:hypothetical protein
MRHLSRPASAAAWILLAGFALSGTACVATASGRIYDPVYGDYHYWNNDEESTFQVYLTERNLPHREFRSMSKSEQGDYWKWRHNRPAANNPH